MIKKQMLDFKIDVRDIINKLNSTDLMLIKEDFNNVLLVLKSNETIKEKSKAIKKILNRNKLTQSVLLRTIKSIVWDNRSLPIKTGLVTFLGSSMLVPGLNLGVATAGFGFGISVSLVSGMLGIVVGAILSEIDQINLDARYICTTCDSDFFNWKGWPLKDKIDYVNISESSICPKCKTSNTEIKSLKWIPCGSATGLPDFWKITSNSSDEFTKWGQPIRQINICNVCERPNLLVYHSNEGTSIICGCTTKDECNKKVG
jgi:hypothetical protein